MGTTKDVVDLEPQRSREGHETREGHEAPEDNAPDADVIWIGCVMTNQARKDWGLAAQLAQLLRLYHPNLRWWWHVDTDLRAWSIPALLMDHGIADIVHVTHEMSDRELACCYHACRLTILPTLGEGFGYPVFESMAAGTPCVTTSYAGAGSLLYTFDDTLIRCLSGSGDWRLEGPFNCLRPATDIREWLGLVKDRLARDTVEDVYRGYCREVVEHLRHRNLWPRWRRWFEDGIGWPELETQEAHETRADEGDHA